MAARTLRLVFAAPLLFLFGGLGPCRVDGARARHRSPLAHRRSGAAARENATADVALAAGARAGERGTTAVDVFVRTFARDAEIIRCLWQSLQEAHVAPPLRRAIVVVPPSDVQLFQETLESLGPSAVPFVVKASRDATLNFNNDIFHADTFSNADFMVHMDADMMLHRDVDVVSPGGRAYLLLAPYELAGPGWERTLSVNTEQLQLFFGPGDYRDVVLGRQVFPREAYGSFRARVEAAHQPLAFEDFVRSVQSVHGIDGYMALAHHALTHHGDKTVPQVLFQRSDVEDPAVLTRLDSYHALFMPPLKPLVRQSDGRHGVAGC